MIRVLADLAARTFGLAVLWIVISEGRPEFWYYGVITVIGAVAVSAWMMPLGRPIPSPAQWWIGFRFVIWFAGQAVKGAVDVARRALGPARLVDPLIESVPLRLSPGQGGLLTAACCNLMPGSLAFDLTHDHVALHSLAPELKAAASWEELQSRIERLTGGRRFP